MSDSLSDFVKLWTQGDQESELKMKNVLLDGLDSVVQAQSDVLSKMRVEEPAASPVVRWMEEWGYPSRVTARLSGDTMVF